MTIRTTFSTLPSSPSASQAEAANGRAAPAVATPAAWSRRRRLSCGPPEGASLVIEALLQGDELVLGRLAHVEQRGADLRGALGPSLELLALRLERRLEEVDLRALVVRADLNALRSDRPSVDVLLVADAGERDAALVLGVWGGAGGGGLPCVLAGGGGVGGRRLSARGRAVVVTAAGGDDERAESREEGYAGRHRRRRVVNASRFKRGGLLPWQPSTGLSAPSESCAVPPPRRVGHPREAGAAGARRTALER